MKKLKIKNFKAHQNLDEINFDEKNFLLYGDNGAGKSSIYEALKLCFFKNRLEEGIKKQATPENQDEKVKEFYREFNNKILNQDFEIKINNSDFNTFPIEEYNVYMLSFEDITFDKTLKLKDYLEKLFTNIPDFNYLLEPINPKGKKLFERINNLLYEIEKKANKFLKNCFEDIQIEIDYSDDFAIKVKNKERNIESTKEIKKYFNEGKINLIIFALFFATIEVSKDNSKKNILILDDFITSLDMANRTFLMRYIFDTFKDFQILIFTHNIYFYNMIIYLINDKICETNKDWQFANLYGIGNEHKIYINDTINDTVSNIIEKYKPNENGFDTSKYGNELRQKFERLLYELSKIMMIGGVEESNKILNAILNDKFYLNYTTNKDCQDLITEIEDKINENASSEYIGSMIRSKILSYKVESLDEIKEVLKTLKLYRKVTMHSLSHGQKGQHNWSDKEIKQTQFLLKKLETNIKDLTNGKVN